MKKIFLFTALALVAFSSNGCSGDIENTNVNRITLVVDGLTKTFNNILVNANGADTVIITGQVGGSTLETIEIEVYKNATGTGAIADIIFTQDSAEYYSSIGNSIYTNVTENGAERKIKGVFGGSFKTLSNSNKVIDNGQFSISY